MPGTKHIITSNNSSNYKSVTNVERSPFIFHIHLVYCLCLWTKWMRKSSSITHCKWPSEHLEVSWHCCHDTHVWNFIMCSRNSVCMSTVFFPSALVMGNSRNLLWGFPCFQRLVLKTTVNPILTVTIANGLNLSDGVKSTTISLSQQLTFVFHHI